MISRNILNVFVSIALASAVTGCKGDSKSKVKAIRLANKSFSLLPGRLYAPSGTGLAYENSIRMVMLPIGCSASQIRTLEELVAKNVEAIKHSGTKIVGL